MSEQKSELSDAAKTAILRYLLKIVIPSGAVLGVVASILTFQVKEVATTKATIEAYNQANSKIHDLLIQTAEAHSDANNIRQKLRDTETETQSLRSEIQNARSEIETILQKTKDSSSLIESEKSVEKVAEVLEKSEYFIKKVQLLGQLPVGSVMPSFISAEEFAKLKLGDKWVPADGRTIPENSLYSVVTGKTNVPDLRGMFLRGLNEFVKGEKRSDGLEDPEGTNRKVGSYQNDEFAKHRHETEGYYHSLGKTSFTLKKGEDYGVSLKSNETEVSPDLENDGGMETRPKNVAVFYYVKIN